MIDISSSLFSVADFIFVLIFLVALALSLAQMPQLNRLALRTGVIDHPDDRKDHAASIPLLGGLGIALAFIITGLVFFEYTREFIGGLLAGLGIILVTGLVDDIWHLRPALKFSGEILAALVFLTLADVHIIQFGNLVGSGPLTTEQYAIPISVFCMVGVMNALNMADGLDGLAGGISAIGALFLAWFAWHSGQSCNLAIMIALFGSLLGFLYFNSYPARIFMGDTGSLVLGYLLSAVAILLVQPAAGRIEVVPISMATVLGFPIVDAMIVMSVRGLHGINPFSPDKTHIHHRLMRLGFSHRQAVWVIYIAMFSCGLLATFIRDLPESLQFTIGIAYATLMFGSVYLLNFFDFRLGVGNPD